MKKSEVLILIPLIPAIPFYLGYRAAKEAINPDVETLHLMASIRILSLRTKLYRARSAGLLETDIIASYHASTSALCDELESWKGRQEGSRITKRRRLHRELKALNKRIVAHEKMIEERLKEARLKRVEFANDNTHGNRKRTDISKIDLEL